jgi:hypothetical protein
MFVSAIEKVSHFTRPMHTVSRTYGGSLIPGTATFFFVNEEGVAVTCKHVVQMLAQADAVNQQYNLFREQRDRLRRDSSDYTTRLQMLEEQYQYNVDSLIQLKVNFRNAFDSIGHLQWEVHPTLDLAILRFNGYHQRFYDSYATFVSDPGKVKQGRTLCRLGYPFPEFNNFQHNPTTDDIDWTNTGMVDSPSFPIDGIITRFGGTPDGHVGTIELSTPGLRGQSGGPLFDMQGLVYGIQSMTQHLHLGFDIHEMEILNNGNRMKVSNYPFLHVGHCIHVDRIKEFLRLHNVTFYEEY